MTNIGSSGGIAYQPGVCGPKQYRTSIIKSYDDKTTGEVNFNFKFIFPILFIVNFSTSSSTLTNDYDFLGRL